MIKIMTTHLKLPLEHVKPHTSPPSEKPNHTLRPEYTKLGIKALEDQGVGKREDGTFDE